MIVKNVVCRDFFAAVLLTMYNIPTYTRIRCKQICIYRHLRVAHLLAVFHKAHIEINKSDILKREKKQPCQDPDAKKTESIFISGYIS